MRCVCYVTKDIFFCLVEYAVRYPRRCDLRAARPMRLLVAVRRKPEV